MLLGNGDGTLKSAVAYGTGWFDAASVAIGDLNGDGKPDLVVGSEYECTPGCPTGAVSVLLGNGDGTFQSAVVYSTGGDYSLLVKLYDLNGDGKLDLVASHVCQAVGGCPQFAGGGVGVLLGNGDGTFQPYQRYSSGGDNAFAVVVVDVDGDGKPDLLLTNQCSSAKTGVCFADGAVGVLLNKHTTTTTVASSLNPSQVNQFVTFTATVASVKVIPNGEVITFYNGSTLLGTGTTNNGAATLTTSFSNTGTYTIRAKYPGDNINLPSTGTVKQLVN